MCIRDSANPGQAHRGDPPPRLSGAVRLTGTVRLTRRARLAGTAAPAGTLHRLSTLPAKHFGPTGDIAASSWTSRWRPRRPAATIGRLLPHSVWSPRVPRPPPAPE